MRAVCEAQRIMHFCRRRSLSLAVDAFTHALPSKTHIRISSRCTACRYGSLLVGGKGREENSFREEGACALGRPIWIASRAYAEASTHIRPVSFISNE